MLGPSRRSLSKIERPTRARFGHEIRGDSQRGISHVELLLLPTNRFTYESIDHADDETPLNSLSVELRAVGIDLLVPRRLTAHWRPRFARQGRRGRSRGQRQPPDSQLRDPHAGRTGVSLYTPVPCPTRAD